jgi:hypothetical protein
VRNHGNRPSTVFYTLNRRFRVVRRFGTYQVQRKRKVDQGNNLWQPVHSYLGSTLADATKFCGELGLPYVFNPEIGWQ